MSIAGSTAFTAITAATLATELFIQTLIEVAPELIKIRRAISRLATVLTRVLIVIILGAATPAWVVQRKTEAEFLEKRSELAGTFRVEVFFHLE